MMHRHTKPNRAGFTLLEMLIASGLAATLMILVWSLFSVYSKLNDKGASGATELQLVRSLMRQLRSDLHQARAYAERPAEPFTQSQGRPAFPPVGEVRGGESWLQLVVRAPRDEGGPATPLDAQKSDSPDVYHVVKYVWRSGAVRQPEEQLEEQPMDSVGLTRRVVPQFNSMGHQIKQEDRVPEIVKLRFRYFDGISWHKGWDSRGRGLPAAIEIAFDLQAKVEREPLEMDEQTENNSDQLIEEPPPAAENKADSNKAGANEADLDKVDVDKAGETLEFEYRFVVVVSPKNRVDDHEEAMQP